MKNRKGHMRLYYEDGDTNAYEDIPISDQNPEPGEFRLYARWGNESWQKIKRKSAVNDPRALNYLARWERSQRVLTEQAYQKGQAAAGDKRHQSAADYWKPHQDEFNRLCSEGMKPGKARHEIRKKIMVGETWPPPYAANMKNIQKSPSDSVLKRWLK